MHKICIKYAIKYAEKYARNMTNMQRNMTNMHCGSIIENMQENMQNMQNLRTMPKKCKICTPHPADAGPGTTGSPADSEPRPWPPGRLSRAATVSATVPPSLRQDSLDLTRD